MKRRNACVTGRRGFTLVELLVVIAIITILMGLLLAAVMRITGRVEEVQTRNDLSQLSQAIQSFKTKYKVEQFPSRLLLAATKSGFTGKLGADSFQYINRVWPHIQWTDNSGKEITHNWPVGLLEGHQCLVFFLGGPPVGPGGAPAGFSTNPLDPFEPPTAGRERVSFFDFPVNRLSTAAGFFKSGSNNATFPCLLDPYKKMPYAYFSSYKTDNGYNRYAGDTKSNAGWGTNSDCISLGVWPYAENPNPTPKYLNPSTFQIISAGRDKTFGRGYQLNPADGANSVNNVWSAQKPLSHALYWSKDNTNTTAGQDDMANFHELMLGIPAN